VICADFLGRIMSLGEGTVIKPIGIRNAVLTASLMLFSTSAYAVTFNFGILAQSSPLGVGEGDWDSRPTDALLGFDGTTDIWTQGLIGVKATANNSVGGPPPVTDPTTVAYLDNLFKGEPGGLGACSSDLVFAQCSTPSDDNIGVAGDNGSGIFETVFSEFDTSVSITSLLFRDREHIPLTANDALKLFVVGGFVIDATLDIMNGLVVGFFSFGVTAGDLLGFERIAGGADFYLEAIDASACTSPLDPDCSSETPIPLPAALPLFLSALGGMGLLGWRRRRKAVA